MRAGFLFHRQELRVPRHRGGDIGRGERTGNIRICGIDRPHIGHREACRFKRPGEQIMRHRQLDQIDLLSGDTGEIVGAFEQDPVIAIRIVADDQGGGILPAGGGDGQRIHVRDRYPVKLPGGVLIDRFDVIVDLHDIEFDPVFVPPLLHDSGLFGIRPRHPPGIDRPADRELRLGRGGVFACGRARGDE